MELLLCILFFLVSAMAAGHSLGLGIASLIAVGYFYGILRGNYFGPAITFVFDAAVFGLYLIQLFRRPSPWTSWNDRAARGWTFLLIAWPLLLFFIPRQSMLVQAVGFRAAVLFLPFLVLGARLERPDVIVITRSIALLNIVALAFAGAEYFLGVDRFFQESIVTAIIFNSNDIAGGHHRIPATFLNAHTYGGTMLMSFPFLISRFAMPAVGKSERGFMGFAMVAALLGIFLCGARLPVVVLIISIVLFLILNKLSLKWLTVFLVLGSLVALAVESDERLQRFTSLGNAADVEQRIHTSVNDTSYDLIADYPLGAGLARSFGTSIPYFLQSRAMPQIYAENEYVRVVIEQGWVGGILLLSLLIWTFTRFNFGSDEFVVFRKMAYAVSASFWMTAFIGTGALTAIPSSPIVLILMGMLSRPRLPQSYAAYDPAPLLEQDPQVASA